MAGVSFDHSEGSDVSTNPIPESIFLAPHNDDETLFGAFTLQRHRPHVVVVLRSDYGCGRQPYRELIERAGGEYVPWDRAGFASSVTHEDVGPEHITAERFDVIVCTQVIQYMPAPDIDLIMFSTMLRPDGHLVLTGPTNWPEVEASDRQRFTLAGAIELVTFAGFEIEVSGTRAEVDIPGWTLSLGWGIVGRR